MGKLLVMKAVSQNINLIKYKLHEWFRWKLALFMKIWYPRLPPLQEKVNRTLWATILKSVFLELLNHFKKALLESSLAVTLQNVFGLCQYKIKGGTSIELSLTYDIIRIWMKVFPPPKLQTRLNPHCFIGLFFFYFVFFMDQQSKMVTKHNKNEHRK